MNWLKWIGCIILLFFLSLKIVPICGRIESKEKECDKRREQKVVNIQHVFILLGEVPVLLFLSFLVIADY